MSSEWLPVSAISYTEAKVREVLLKSESYTARIDETTIVLDGVYTIEELEAILCWMNNRSGDTPS